MKKRAITVVFGTTLAACLCIAGGVSKFGGPRKAPADVYAEFDKDLASKTIVEKWAFGNRLAGAKGGGLTCSEVYLCSDKRYYEIFRVACGKLDLTTLPQTVDGLWREDNKGQKLLLLKQQVTQLTSSNAPVYSTHRTIWVRPELYLWEKQFRHQWEDDPNGTDILNRFRLEKVESTNDPNHRVEATK